VRIYDGVLLLLVVVLLLLLLSNRTQSTMEKIRNTKIQDIFSSSLYSWS